MDVLQRCSPAPSGVKVVTWTEAALAATFPEKTMIDLITLKREREEHAS